MTAVNDIVLIFLEDKPVSFARVESIFPDHKKDWFQIKLLMLQVPEKVVCPDTDISELSLSPGAEKEKTDSSRKSSGKVVSLSAFRRKKE